jgi:deazaflavin-dependent oxidoreductase (nitroreductase family)
VVPLLSRLARRLGSRPWFAKVGPVFVPLDRRLSKLTKGRFIAFGLRDLPSLLLITTGRRTGQSRANPLLYATDGDAFVVVGSNWGRRNHPAWSGNLVANPRATVMLAGDRISVRARLATGAERDRLLGMLRTIWPAYSSYEEWASGRDIRVFRLERTGPSRRNGRTS